LLKKLLRLVIPGDDVKWNLWRDERKALLQFQVAGTNGSKEAQKILGEIYELAKGVNVNYQEAVKRYRIAGDQGDPRAETRLGVMLFHGRGMAQNIPEAIKLWTEAAGQGDAYAQFNLAELYIGMVSESHVIFERPTRFLSGLAIRWTLANN
jgi:TPR repeat protein